MPKKFRINDDRAGIDDRFHYHGFLPRGISEKTMEEIGAEDGSSVFRSRKPASPRSPRSPRHNDFGSDSTAAATAQAWRGKESVRFPTTAIARAKRALHLKMERAMQRASVRAVR